MSKRKRKKRLVRGIKRLWLRLKSSNSKLSKLKRKKRRSRLKTSDSRLSSKEDKKKPSNQPINLYLSKKIWKKPQKFSIIKNRKPNNSLKNSKILKITQQFKTLKMSIFNQVSFLINMVNPKSNMKKRQLLRSIKLLLLALLTEKMHLANFMPMPRTKPRKELLKLLVSSRISLIQQSHKYLQQLTTLVKYAQISKNLRPNTSKNKVKCKTTTCSSTRQPWLKLITV